MQPDKPQDIDAFIATFPPATQALMQQLRKAIQEAAPESEETINYGIPTFTLHGNLVHFSAYKKHIGFYPGAAGIEAFKNQLAGYKGAKGSVQFPLDEPLPLALVQEIVRFRVQQNLQKAISKKTRRTCKNGHTFYKSSECPTCPICEAENKPSEGFLSLLSAPARRALQQKGIVSLQHLAQYSEAEIRHLHGIGPSTIPKLQEALQAACLSFKVL